MDRSKDARELEACFYRSPHPSVKISTYFPAYAEMFSHLRGTRCTFIETGVLDGGSLFMWRMWLGSNARIIGIDMNPDAKKWQEAGFEIYIGDQGDPAVLRSAFSAIGPFDALLDDGGHQSFQQAVTLNEALRHATTSCVIAIEDTATSYMKDYAAHGDYSFLELAKRGTDMLTARMTNVYPERMPSVVNPDASSLWAKVASIRFYPGIVALQVDPSQEYAPTLVRNMPAGGATDFRYKGIDNATVRWPDPYRNQTVTIRGGALPGQKSGWRARWIERLRFGQSR